VSLLSAAFESPAALDVRENEHCCQCAEEEEGAWAMGSAMKWVTCIHALLHKHKHKHAYTTEDNMALPNSDHMH
jgi:hypothetical protein